MKKKIYKVSGKSHLLSQPPGKIAEIEEAYHFEMRPGNWVIIENRKTGERFRAMVFQSHDKLQLSYRGELFNGQWLESVGSSTGESGGEGDDSQLEAQFPGKIRKILVKQGESIKQGAPLLLVEAMKMEFSISAPYSAIVEKILVKEGQQIMPGARYVELKKVSESK